jgi:hypothetical protein
MLFNTIALYISTFGIVVAQNAVQENELSKNPLSSLSLAKRDLVQASSSSSTYFSTNGTAFGKGFQQVLLFLRYGSES